MNRNFLKNTPLKSVVEFSNLQSLRDVSKGIAVGSGIAFSVIAGGFIGYKLGQTVDLGPIGLIVGLLLGLVAALRGVINAFPEESES